MSEHAVTSVPTFEGELIRPGDAAYDEARAVSDDAGLVDKSKLAPKASQLQHLISFAINTRRPLAEVVAAEDGEGAAHRGGEGPGVAEADDPQDGVGRRGPRLGRSEEAGVERP